MEEQKNQGNINIHRDVDGLLKKVFSDSDVRWKVNKHQLGSKTAGQTHTDFIFASTHYNGYQIIVSTEESWDYYQNRAMGIDLGLDCRNYRKTGKVVVKNGAYKTTIQKTEKELKDEISIFITGEGGEE